MKRFILAVALVLMLAPTLNAAPPVLHGCQIFPADNPWNVDISGAPVHPNSKNFVKNINDHGGDFVHPDFGGGVDDWYGIPWTIADDSTPLVPVSFDYDDESDPGPYPIPDDAPIEGGGDIDGDRHVLVIQTDDCVLYEMYYSYPNDVGGDIVSWDAGSGAVYDLSSNAVRPEGWTSADAAGLPILPGLAKCDEAESVDGITHALRFTVNATQRAFIYPATHYASSNTGANFPPMGLRFRLKANYNESRFEGQALAIVRALKKYGMIVADNGSNWYISGEYNPNCWDDDDLNELKTIPGTAFEAIVSPPPPNEVAGDIMKNGSFEAGEPKGKKPSYWTMVAHKDRRQCDHDGLTFANTGRCAFEFKGTGAGPTDYISQSVNVSAFQPLAQLDVAFYTATENAAAGAGKLKLKYVFDDTSGSETIQLASGTNGFQQVTHAISGANVAGLKKVKFRFSYKGTSGKIWLDSISMVPDAARGALPVPPPAN